MLVTPKSVVIKVFSRFINKKRMLYQLNYIIIDKYYTLLELIQDQQLDLLKIAEIIEKRIQVIYLTIILPPILQPTFLQTIGLNTQTITIYRDESTTRTNIIYQVLEYIRGILEKVLIKLIAIKRRKYRLRAQIIIYYLTIDKIKRLIRLLQYLAYYYKIDLDKKKARIV